MLRAYYLHIIQEPDVAVSMNLFKLYLGRVLGSIPEGMSEEALQSGPLQLYKHGPRLQIAKILLAASSELGKPGPYIPIFYKESPFLKINQSSTVSKLSQVVVIVYIIR